MWPVMNLRAAPSCASLFASSSDKALESAVGGIGKAVPPAYRVDEAEAERADDGRSLARSIAWSRARASRSRSMFVCQFLELDASRSETPPEPDGLRPARRAGGGGGGGPPGPRCAKVAETGLLPMGVARVDIMMDGLVFDEHGGRRWA